MIVLIIFLITAFILKLLKVVLNQVEAGRLQLPGIHPETVGATRKLISVVVWLFALSAAYPFLPGANSLAFKGISVFFGLMLTLGSAGVMNHAMSGLVLIYSRALRKGDMIRVADNEGLVSEIGIPHPQHRQKAGNNALAFSANSSAVLARYGDRAYRS